VENGRWARRRGSHNYGLEANPLICPSPIAEQKDLCTEIVDRKIIMWYKFKRELVEKTKKNYKNIGSSTDYVIGCKWITVGAPCLIFFFSFVYPTISNFS